MECDERDACVAPRKRIRCAHCAGRGIDLGSWSQALERFARVGSRRPIPIEQYDQAFVTPESTMARLAVMADRVVDGIQTDETLGGLFQEALNLYDRQD